MFLYCTADTVGLNSGGGKVTYQECKALSSLGETLLFDRKYLTSHSKYPMNDPWDWDREALQDLPDDRDADLAHFYSGTFSETVSYLKRSGTKVVYTVAAHSIEASRREHEKYGINYSKLYPHLCDPDLWNRYSKGYFESDVLVAPSQHSKEVLEHQGAKNRIEVIPHGCDYPTGIRPLPRDFVVGYMGAVGPDKGLKYLIEAWKKLDYKNAILILAGRESISDHVRNLIFQIGGGNIILLGWVNDLFDFYSQLNLYIQPSVTEGFGIEVIEAMAHGRPVLCSEGAGAKDAVDTEFRFPPCDSESLANLIDKVKSFPTSLMEDWSKHNREKAKDYTWDKVRSRYLSLWEQLLQ